MASHRKERLEELIKRIVGDLLYTEVKDPRIGFSTIVRVKLSADYSVADIWVSVMGSEADKHKAIAGLESASKYIQHLVGKEIQLRITPRIVFHLDSSIEKAVNLVNLIEDVNKLKSGNDSQEKNNEDISDK